MFAGPLNRVARTIDPRFPNRQLPSCGQTSRPCWSAVLPTSGRPLIPHTCAVGSPLQFQDTEPSGRRDNRSPSAYPPAGLSRCRFTAETSTAAPLAPTPALQSDEDVLPSVRQPVWIGGPGSTASCGSVRSSGHGHVRRPALHSGRPSSQPHLSSSQAPAGQQCPPERRNRLSVDRRRRQQTVPVRVSDLHVSSHRWCLAEFRLAFGLMVHRRQCSCGILGLATNGPALDGSSPGL